MKLRYAMLLALIFAASAATGLSAAGAIEPAPASEATPLLDGAGTGLKAHSPVTSTVSGDATGASASSAGSTKPAAGWFSLKTLTTGKDATVNGFYTAGNPFDRTVCQKDSYMPALNGNVVIGGALTLATAGTLLYYGLTDVRAYMKANSLTGFQGFRTAVKAVALELKDTKPAIAYTLAILYGVTAAMFASKLVGGAIVGVPAGVKAFQDWRAAK